MTEPQPPAFVEGPAFSPLVKGLACVLMAALVYYALRAAGAFQSLGSPALSFLALMVLLGTALGIGWWWIIVSRTSVSAEVIRQTWWSTKEVRIADITQTKLVLIPGLTWIVVPRLVVRTRSPGSIVFHAAEPRVIAAFARIALGLPPLP